MSDVSCLAVRNLTRAFTWAATFSVVVILLAKFCKVSILLLGSILKENQGSNSNYEVKKPAASK